MTTVTQAAAYIQQVKMEVVKVTWPGWPELRQTTTVIIIVVIIIGIIIGLMDMLFSRMFIDFLPRFFR